MVELTAAHWVYALFIVLILLTMALKRETPIVCVVGSLVLSWVITGDLVKAVQAVFNAVTVAAAELLGVVVIISMIVAMAKMMEETGLAEMMFRPVVGLMKTPTVAFWVVEGLAKGAFEALVARQAEKHDELVTSVAERVAGQTDVIVLAQGSMARMEETLAKRTGKPVLSSPRRGVLEVKETLERMAR